MTSISRLSLLSLLFLQATLPATETEPHPAAVSSLLPDELMAFAENQPEIRQIITKSLELTKLGLRYTFGSSDPATGGLDCSGAVYRVLQDCGLKDTPRQSDELCAWVTRQSALHRTEFPTSFDSPAFSALKPGDLVFWSGTYDPAVHRELPITHVMIYLGKRRSDGKPILFGASDGRSYDGQRRSGVSVFDFHIPKPGDKSAIYGYGRIPGLPKQSIPTSPKP
jgi:NlpC/P60 family